MKEVARVISSRRARSCLFIASRVLVGNRHRDARGTAALRAACQGASYVRLTEEFHRWPK